MLYARLSLVSALLLSLPLAACGGDDDEDGDDDVPGLDDYLPDIPEPTGEAQSVFAGLVDTGNADSELIPGSAASGTVGDVFIRNSRGRFVIQAPGRVIGVIPQGGNLVDAQPVGEDGPVGEDHFGELSSIYVLGRTCEHETIEIVQDGSEGGVAAVVARGASAANDFINIKGIGLLPVEESLDPDIPDSVECATTYVLPPDSPTMEVYWTFYNAGDTEVRGPLGALSDTGGNVEVWAPTRGFERLGIEAIADSLAPAPVEYAVYQGPGVAYGIVPQHEDLTTPNSSFLIAGVSIILYGATQLLDIVSEEGTYLELPASGGVTHGAHVVVGRDASDVEEEVLAARGGETRELAGQVSWEGGDPAVGARVGVFEDADGDGEVGPEDPVLSYMDTDAQGRFAGQFEPGEFLLRADMADQSRSATIGSDAGDLSLVLARPVRHDYRIVDDETGEFIPAKLIVIGENPAAADQRVHSVYDRFEGLVGMIQSVRGTSTDVGEGGDPPILLAPGSDYRVLTTRGTEWSIAETVLSPAAGDDPPEIEFRLRRVVDTAGYVASEYHVHSIGSPDSPVEWPTRVATAAADGVEVFASTEHDYVADLQPVVEEMALERWLRVLPGIEVTPFAYGHFNAWPLDPDPASPNRGAIDWARGAEGFAMTPGEIFAAMRNRGAELVEVNHPRALPGGLTDFMNYFDRVDLAFDYTNRAISGNLDGQPVANEFLRLAPESQLWDVDFNALEVWNGFGTADTDRDGKLEIQSLDVVMRDWFNFLSFGLQITPIGNSDTHTIARDPMGMPRTLVAVPDDSPEALADGSVVAPLIDNLAGRGPTPRDVVLTNGPHIRVTSAGDTASVIGSELAAEDGQVQLDISVQAPTWAAFDVVEVFANAVPELGANQTALAPIKCYVTVAPESLPESDPCASAPLGAEQMTVDRVPVGEGDAFERFETSVALTLRPEDEIHPEGGIGQDAWVVVRARGNRSIYPVLMGDILSAENLGVLVGGSPEEIEALLDGAGVPASAFTAPIYLDLDGGGYRAPFAPE